MSDNISKYVEAISTNKNFNKVNEEKNKYDQEFSNTHISNTLADMDINSHTENGIVRVYPHKVVGSLKEDLDESSNIRYNKDQFDLWKNQATIMGHKIRQATGLDGEFGDYYTAKDREGNFKGQFHKKLGGHLKEDLDEGYNQYNYNAKVAWKNEVKKFGAVNFKNTDTHTHAYDKDGNRISSFNKKTLEYTNKKVRNRINESSELEDLSEEELDEVNYFKSPRKGTLRYEIEKRRREQYLKDVAKDPHGRLKDGDIVTGPSGNSIFRRTDGIKESTDDILDKHIQNFSKGIKSSEPKNSRYKKDGKIIPNHKYIETDVGHQDIFNHLIKMGYKKTKGYDPDPHKFTLSHNIESMTSQSDPVHHTDRISAHVSNEHGNRKTLVHFNKWPNINESSELEDLSEEELMELDKKTLASYIKKASSDVEKNSRKLERAYTNIDNDNIDNIDYDEITGAEDKLNRRHKGIFRATDRLVKESNDKDIYGNPISAREKLYRNHQNIRNRAGLPDPNYYLELAKKKKQKLEQMQDKNNK